MELEVCLRAHQCLLQVIWKWHHYHHLCQNQVLELSEFIHSFIFICFSSMITFFSGLRYLSKFSTEKRLRNDNFYIFLLIDHTSFFRPSWRPERIVGIFDSFVARVISHVRSERGRLPTRKSEELHRRR